MAIVVTFLSGIFIGVMFPMIFRLFDRTSLRATIEVYNGWNDGTEERKTILTEMEEDINKQIRRRKTRICLLVVITFLFLVSFAMMLFFVGSCFVLDMQATQTI